MNPDFYEFLPICLPAARRLVDAVLLQLAVECYCLEVAVRQRQKHGYVVWLTHGRLSNSGRLAPAKFSASFTSLIFLSSFNYIEPSSSCHTRRGRSPKLTQLMTCLTRRIEILNGNFVIRSDAILMITPLCYKNKPVGFFNHYLKFCVFCEEKIVIHI